MIDNRDLIASEWRYILYIIVTIVFVLGVLFKRLSDDLHEKLDKIDRERSLLQPCPFCGKIPDVRNGCFLCKSCRLTMRIPFKNYKNVEDMLNQTWNKRWKNNFNNTKT